MGCSTPLSYVHVSLLILLVSTMFCASSCADFTGDTSITPRQTSQAAGSKDPDAFNLGQGVRVYNSSGEVKYKPLNAYCKKGSKDIDWEHHETTVRTMYSYREDYIEELLGFALDIDIGKTDGLGFSTKNAIEEEFGQETTARKLVLVARVETGKKSYLDDGGEQPNGKCQASNPYTTFSQFHQNCGQEYVSSQTVGGMIVLTKDVSTLNRDQRKTLTSNTSLNAPGGGGSVDTVLENINNTSGLDAEFEIYIFGNLVTPSNAFTTGELTFTEWLNYIDKLKNHRGGTVLRNTFAPYRTETYTDCGVDWEEKQGEVGPAQAYSCYSDLAWRIRNSNSSFHDVHAYAARVDWLLTNQNFVDWGDTPTQNRGEYTSWMNNYDNCKSNESQKIEDCRIAMSGSLSSGDYDNVCGVCSRDNACTVEDMEREYDDLPSSYIRIPANVKLEAPQGNSNYTEPSYHDRDNAEGIGSLNKPVSSNVCVLTSVSGGFGGYGEQIRLWNSNGSWTLQNKSARTDPDHYVKAKVHCTPKSNFFGTNGPANLMDPINETVESNDGSVESETLVPSTPTLPYNRSKYVHALSGISGKMQGGAEQGKVKEYLPLEELEVKSNQGAIKAFATSFGLSNPMNNGGADPVLDGSESVSNGATKQETENLIPIDEGICYLTHVGGELDGAGEVAEVRQRGEYWQLRAKGVCHNHRWLGLSKKCKKNGANFKRIEAYATCYRYNQN